MDHADIAPQAVTPASGEAAPLPRLREATDLIWQAARLRSLDVLDRAIATGAAGIDLAVTAGRAKSLANEAVAAAELMRSHLRALDALGMPPVAAAAATSAASTDIARF